MSSNHKVGGTMPPSGGKSKNYSNNNNSKSNNSNSNSKPNINTKVINRDRDRTPSPLTDGSTSPLGFDLSPVNSGVQGTWTKPGGKSWYKGEESPWIKIGSAKVEDLRQLKSPSPTSSIVSGGSNKYSVLGIRADGDCNGDDDNVSVSSFSSVGTASSSHTESSTTINIFTLVDSVEGKCPEEKDKIIRDFINKCRDDEITEIKELKTKLYIRGLGYLGGETNPVDFVKYDNQFSKCKDRNFKNEEEKKEFAIKYSKKKQSDWSDEEILFDHVKKLVNTESNDKYINYIIKRHLEYQGFYRKATRGIMTLQLVKSLNSSVLEYLCEQSQRNKGYSVGEDNQIIKLRRENREKLINDPEYINIKEKKLVIQCKLSKYTGSTEESIRLSNENNILHTRLLEIEDKFLKLLEEEIAVQNESENNLIYDINEMPLSELSDLHICSWVFKHIPMRDKTTGEDKMNESERKTLLEKVKRTLGVLLKNHNILTKFNSGNNNKIFLRNLLNNNGNLHPDFIEEVYNFVMEYRINDNDGNDKFWFYYFRESLNLIKTNLQKHFIYIGITKFPERAFIKIFEALIGASNSDANDETNKTVFIENLNNLIFARNYPTFYKPDGSPTDVEFNKYYENLGEECHLSLPERIVSYILENSTSIINNYSKKDERTLSIANKGLFMFLGEAYRRNICRAKIISFINKMISSNDTQTIESFIFSVIHFIFKIFENTSDIRFESLDSEVKRLFEHLACLYTNGPIYFKYSSNFDNIFGKGSFKKIFESTKETASTLSSVSTVSTVSATSSASGGSQAKLPEIDQEIFTALTVIIDINPYINDKTKINSKFEVNQALALAFCEAIASLYSIDKIRALVNLIDNTGALKELIKAQEEQVPGLFDYYIKEFFGCVEYREWVKEL
jgi:hypothetical protein